MIAALSSDAMAIWLPDLPVDPGRPGAGAGAVQLHLLDQLADGREPWNMPVSWWATFNLVINGYPNPETGEWVAGISRRSSELVVSR